MVKRSGAWFDCALRLMASVMVERLRGVESDGMRGVFSILRALYYSIHSVVMLP